MSPGAFKAHDRNRKECFFFCLLPKPQLNLCRQSHVLCTQHAGPVSHRYYYSSGSMTFYVHLESVRVDVLGRPYVWRMFISACFGIRGQRTQDRYRMGRTIDTNCSRLRDGTVLFISRYRIHVSQMMKPTGYQCSIPDREYSIVYSIQL